MCLHVTMTIFLLLLLVVAGEGLRILSVMPVATTSHYAASRKIMVELLDRGHEVVCISPYEERNMSQNFTWVEVQVKSLMDAAPHMAKEFEHNLGVILNQERLYRLMRFYVSHITELPTLRRFIQEDRSHFDLILAEDFHLPIFYLLSTKYDAPLVLLSAFGPGHAINNNFGNPLELAYVPHEFSNVIANMNVIDRFLNAFSTLIDLLLRKYCLYSHQDVIARDLFGFMGNVPDLEAVERNASLILLNSHFSMTTTRPFLPNMIEIGGVHVGDSKPLNKEFQNLLDGADDGAILVSFGSIMDLAMLPGGMVAHVFDALGELNQTVLMKWGTKAPLPRNYSNIHTFKWLPQNDVLAHKNMKLFITHGGLFSSMESILHSVPIICVPFFADQPVNCKRSAALGFGIHIEKDVNFNSSLSNALNSVLNDQSFQNSVNKFSVIFRDRPLSALDTAVYWIEYVARHKNLDHMKGPRRDLYWYQYYFVDVFVIIVVFLLVLKRIVGLFCKRNNKKAKTE